MRLSKEKVASACQSVRDAKDVFFHMDEENQAIIEHAKEQRDLIVRNMDKQMSSINLHQQGSHF